MINYYFKYIELIDTIFLALKKKPLRTSDDLSPRGIVLNSYQNSFTSSTTLRPLYSATLS